MSDTTVVVADLLLHQVSDLFWEEWWSHLFAGISVDRVLTSVLASDCYIKAHVQDISCPSTSAAVIQDIFACSDSSLLRYVIVTRATGESVTLLKSIAHIR